MSVALRWLRNILLGILLLVLLAVGGAYLKEPVLVGRLLSFGGDPGPTRPVAGGNGLTIPPVVETERTISGDAINSAILYGASTESHALLVHQGGRLQIEHYYPGYGPATLTPSQSMHKSVLALLVGVAIAEGYVNAVDDPASDYITEWRGDDRAGISLHNMLQQSSGISFPTITSNVLGGFFQLVLGGDIAPIALEQTAEVPPNSQYDYNSINPQALGIVIERATGKKYWDYLSEALWSKLAADTAYVRIDSEENEMTRTFCCLEATAMDWLRVGLLHLNEGRLGDSQIVPAEWIDAITTASSTNANYGYLTWLGTQYEEYRYYNRKSDTSVYQSEPFAADDVVYFDGFGGQRLYIVPSHDLVIVRLGEIDLAWDEAKLPNTLIRGLSQ